MMTYVDLLNLLNEEALTEAKCSETDTQWSIYVLSYRAVKHLSGYTLDKTGG